MNIGGIIKKYRTRNHFTQEELAEKLAVTPQAVSRWENNLSYPDVAMIPELVHTLGVTADELLGCQNVSESNKQTVLNQDQIDCIFDRPVIQSTSPQKVLIMDDAPFMRFILNDIISNNNHTLIQTKDGDECLATMKRMAENGEKVDVCILDIMMDGMNGFEVLERLRTVYKDTKMIMLSAACDKEAVMKAYELGADGFVAKPFQPQKILEKI